MLGTPCGVQSFIFIYLFMGPLMARRMARIIWTMWQGAVVAWSDLIGLGSETGTSQIRTFTLYPNYCYAGLGATIPATLEVYLAYPWIYRVSRGECARLRENVPYIKVHRPNPKHLYPKLNGYGDDGERKEWSSCGSTYCTCFAYCYPYTAHVRPSVSHQKMICARRWNVLFH